MTENMVYCRSLTVKLDTGIDIRDITSDLGSLLTESGIINGLLTAAIVGSTGSLTTIEYEPGVIDDL